MRLRRAVSNSYRRCRRERTDDIATDQLTGGLHLLVQRGVADDAGRVADLAARLVQARDGADDGALLNFSELGDLAEGLGAVISRRW